MTVVGPRTREYGRDFSVYVTYVKGSSGAVNVTFKIDATDGEEMDKKTFVLENNSNQLVTLKVIWK